MNRQEFFEKLHIAGIGCTPKISYAYWLAKETHRKQTRDQGERYFEHCRRVACFLLEYGKTDEEEIILALLHDCVEDGFIPDGLIQEMFGRGIAQALAILSKIDPVYDRTNGSVVEKKKKVLAKYFLEIQKAPPSVRLVKLADRLDNIRSMNVWPSARQEKYLLETRTYILPIAHKTDWRFANALEEECEKISKELAK